MLLGFSCASQPFLAPLADRREGGRTWPRFPMTRHQNIELGLNQRDRRVFFASKIHRHDQGWLTSVGADAPGLSRPTFSFARLPEQKCRPVERAGQRTYLPARGPRHWMSAITGRKLIGMDSRQQPGRHAASAWLGVPDDRHGADHQQLPQRPVAGPADAARLRPDSNGGGSMRIASVSAPIGPMPGISVSSRLAELALCCAIRAGRAWRSRDRGARPVGRKGQHRERYLRHVRIVRPAAYSPAPRPVCRATITPNSAAWPRSAPTPARPFDQ